MSKKPTKSPSLSPGPPSKETLPPIKKRKGRPPGVKEHKPRMRKESAAKKLNLGAGLVPQSPQERFSVLVQIERLAQYWLARANQEDLLRQAEDEKYSEVRLNLALSRAHSALATLAPYRHARITKMPEPLELSRLTTEELKVFRHLFIKAMATPTPVTIEQGEDDDGE